MEANTVLHKYIPATAIKEAIYIYERNLEDSSKGQKNTQNIEIV